MRSSHYPTGGSVRCPSCGRTYGTGHGPACLTRRAAASLIAALAHAALTLSGCGPITPAGAAAIEAANAVACQSLSFIPIAGPIVAAACAGEEAALAAALNAALAKQAAAASVDGGVTVSKSAVLAKALGPQTAVYALRSKVRKHIGYVPASLAVDVQLELDKAPK